MADVQTDPVAGLIDIPLPPAVSLWPQTLLSRVVCVALAAILIIAACRFLYVWHQNRYRRAALANLDTILKKHASDMVAQLALLVRRTALSVFPRERIADLSGAAWLDFLDRSYGGKEFSSGPGRILSVAPYAQLPYAKEESILVADLVRRWIRTHHV